MCHQRWLVSLALAVALVGGCDKRTDDTPKTPSNPQSTPPPKPQALATEPSTEPTTEPAATRPAVSTLLIDEKSMEFPQARLRVSKSGGSVMALLYSDDPKAAIHDEYTGNSYYLEMPLEIQEPLQIGASEWRYKVDSESYAESGNGIFLHGQTYHLQPADVAAQIEGDMSLVRVHVVGKFLRFDTKNLSAPGVPVFVKGTVLARVEMK